MPPRIFGLTEQDRQRLFAIRDEVQQLTKNTRNRPRTDIDNLHSSDTYIARTPAGGIPRLEEQSGAGVEDRPGSALCSIYRIQGKASDAILEPLPTGLQKRVYNLTTTRIGGGMWIPIVKAKSGHWLACSAADTEGGAGTSTAEGSDTGTGGGDGGGETGVDTTVTQIIGVECVNNRIIVYRQTLTYTNGLLTSTSSITSSIEGCCECIDEATTGTVFGTSTSTSTSDDLCISVIECNPCGTAPEIWILTASGVGNDICTDCDDFNGIHPLVYLAETDCAWRSAEILNCEGAQTGSWYLFWDGSNWRLRLEVNAILHLIEYVLVGTFDCLGGNTFELLGVFGIPYCSAVPAFLTIEPYTEPC